jgi:hypothetical protein
MAGNKYIRTGPVADSVPFDKENDPDCGFISDTVQEVAEELCRRALISASSGFAWGRSGNINKNVWLLNNEVSSNLTGIPFALSSGKITNIWVGNENIKTFDLTIYEHDGDEVNLTALVTVSLVTQKSESFDISDFGTINVTKDKQLAARVTDGSGKNVKAFIVIKGNTQ